MAAGDAVTHLAEACQFLDVHVDQVARCFALVALQRRLGLQVSLPTQPEAIQSPRHGVEGSGQQPGDVA